MKKGSYCKILAVGIIILFMGVTLSSAISINIKNNPQNEKTEDAECLATMTIDFGYNITNAEIIYQDKTHYNNTKYYIGFFINFSIPYDENKKVFIDYSMGGYFDFLGRKPAWWPVYDFLTWDQRFLNYSPPNIYIKKNTTITKYFFNNFYLILDIEAYLEVYEFNGQDWIKTDEDSCRLEKTIDGILSKPRERIYSFLDFIDRFPILQKILTIFK